MNAAYLKCKLSELRCKLSKKYLAQVRSSDEFDLTYPYLFSNKCAKYGLRTFPIFLMLAVYKGYSSKVDDTIQNTVCTITSAPT